jgi:23S rRNA (adenine2503-C2)-methyltransferase
MILKAYSPMRIEQLRQRLRDLGCKPCHEDRLLRGWSQLVRQEAHPVENFFPLALRNELPAIEAQLNKLASLRSEHPAGEGVARLLVELADGQMVESVLLPRGGLCISTQVGCAVGGARPTTARGEQGGIHGHGGTCPQSRQRVGSD